MTTTQESDSGIAVIFDSAPLPVIPKARWYHYLAAYFWNLYRKPLVWKRQREIVQIAKDVKASLELTLLPALYERRATCTACYNAYLSLKPQIFLSQIELILKRLSCEEHPQLFRTFLITTEPEFRKSEKLARWVNGFDS
jgi:hypothetical protein